MSVRIFSNQEIHRLVAAALAWRVIGDDEAAHVLGAQLLRQHVEAFTWSYAEVDAGAFRKLRADVEAYRFVAQQGLEPKAVVRLVDLYIYNAEEEPGWTRSPVRPLLLRLRAAASAHGAPPTETST